jgi:hypothetical protein
MNIYLRELRSGIKPFIIWTIGLCLLVFAGVTKYTGIGAAADSMRAMLASMPKIMLAAFGMADTDIFSFSGYYSVLAFMTFLCTSIYAVYLGGSAVSRESVDKTSEFIFTKPRSRTFILSAKLAADLTFLAAFCLLFGLFSFSAAQTIENSADMGKEIIIYTVACFLMGFIFFALSAMFAAVFTHAEAGARASNLAVLAAYGFSVVYDLLDNGSAVRPVAVFKYFLYTEISAGTVNTSYLIVALAVSAAALVAAYIVFNKRDINYA